MTKWPVLLAFLLMAHQAIAADVAQNTPTAAVPDMAELTRQYPDWAKIVGAVDTKKGEKPDPTQPFRAWLASKNGAYQDRINSTNSGKEIADAITLYLAETRAQAQANRQAQALASEAAQRKKADDTALLMMMGTAFLDGYNGARAATPPPVFTTCTQAPIPGAVINCTSY